MLVDAAVGYGLPGPSYTLQSEHYEVHSAFVITILSKQTPFTHIHTVPKNLIFKLTASPTNSFKSANSEFTTFTIPQSNIKKQCIVFM